MSTPVHYLITLDVDEAYQMDTKQVQANLEAGIRQQWDTVGLTRWDDSALVNDFTVAPYQLNTMHTSLAIHGCIPVAPSAIAALPTLQAALYLYDSERVVISGGYLDVHIEAGNVSEDCITNTVAAIDNFCAAHATTGAVFAYQNDEVLLFGPSAQARRNAYVEYLDEKATEYEALSEQAECRNVLDFTTPFIPE